MPTNNAFPQLYSGASPSEVAADLRTLIDFQSAGMPLSQLQNLLRQQLEPHLMRYASAGFQSMFNARPPQEALWAGSIALEYNQGVTNWQVSPGGAMLEEMCAKALCNLFGLAPTADATFMYSGTYANQQALYMALHRYAQTKGVDYGKDGLTQLLTTRKIAVLVSADAHFSMRHAVRMLGLGEQSLVKLPLDANRRICPIQAANIAQTVAKSADIACIVATSGTTSTGAIDPIKELASIAAQHSAWFHIDGAYGYAYKLVPDYAHKFAGDEAADSISWDPHKQMGAPIPNSLLFLKNGDDFARMSLYSGYFNRAEDVEPNPGLKSPPTTRPLSALPLVAILRGQGLDKVVADLRVPLDNIRWLAAEIERRPRFELCHQPDTGILCFRIRTENGAQLQIDQRQLADRICATGTHSISTTKLDGETVLRIALVSPHVGQSDLADMLNLAEQLAD